PYTALFRSGLLTAPRGGGGQFLSQAWLEMDGVLLEVITGVPETLVQPAQGRAAVAGNEAAGVQPARLIALMLQHRQAGQRLGAGGGPVTGSEPACAGQAGHGPRRGALL